MHSKSRVLPWRPIASWAQLIPRTGRSAEGHDKAAQRQFLQDLVYVHHTPAGPDRLPAIPPADRDADRRAVNAFAQLPKRNHFRYLFAYPQVFDEAYAVRAAA